MTEPGKSRPLPKGLPERTATASLVIITALIVMAACGGEQFSTPANLPVAQGPRATATTVQGTRTQSSAATPTQEAGQPQATEEAASANPVARDSGTSHGQTIFQANCAVCHGAGGEGQPDWHVKKPDGILPAPPLNGDGHTWHHGDGTLYTYVSRGGKFYESPDIPSFKSGMPGFGEILSHEEVIAVIEYLKILWGDKVSQGLELKLSESQALVSENDPFPTAPQ